MRAINKGQFSSQPANQIANTNQAKTRSKALDLWLEACFFTVIAQPKEASDVSVLITTLADKAEFGFSALLHFLFHAIKVGV